MGEWGWVALGYTLTAVSLSGYALLLARRIRAARRRLGDRR
jgi:hypothetical protein